MIAPEFFNMRMIRHSACATFENAGLTQ
jgi:hypothetical protein